MAPYLSSEMWDGFKRNFKDLKNFICRYEAQRKKSNQFRQGIPSISGFSNYASTSFDESIDLGIISIV